MSRMCQACGCPHIKPFHPFLVVHPLSQHRWRMSLPIYLVSLLLLAWGFILKFPSFLSSFQNWDYLLSHPSLRSELSCNIEQRARELLSTSRGSESLEGQVGMSSLTVLSQKYLQNFAVTTIFLKFPLSSLCFLITHFLKGEQGECASLNYLSD